MSRLKPREKRTLAVGGAVFIVLLLSWYFFFWENSLWAKWQDVRDKIEMRENILRRMLKVRRQYLALQLKIDQILSQMTDQGKEMALKGFLEKTVGEKSPSASLNRMKTNINTVHNLYREMNVLVKLDRVLLPELVDLLYSIENEGEALKIKELTIDLNKKNPEHLDVEITIISAVPLEGESSPANEK
jgi:type II secretory pathway component PulM